MTQPTDGTDTVVGNLFRAPGGEAGKNQAIEPDIASASYVAGEDGAVSGISANEVVSYGGRSVDGATANPPMHPEPQQPVAEVAAAEPKEVLPTAHQATTIHIPVTEQTAVTEKLLSNGKNQLLSPAL